MTKRPSKKPGRTKASTSKRPTGKPKREHGRPKLPVSAEHQGGQNTSTQLRHKRAKPPVIGETISASSEALYGKHSVRSVFLKRPNDVEKLILAGKEDYHDDLINLAGRHDVPTYMTSWQELEAAGNFDANDKHQGVLAFVKLREIFSEADFDRLSAAKCVLVLDQVSNPQNLATIIRSAAFFHADAICYMKNRAATPTPEVVRFAVGGAEHVDLYQITNVASVIQHLQELGFWVLGLDERGEKTLAEHDLSQKTAFVVGAEGEGLRAKTKAYCSDLVRIPGGTEGVESLNAAVATTIALYEFSRLKEGG